MRIEFVKPYKSIQQLHTVELPQLVVLSGPNGSGKTQLLEAITRGSLRCVLEGDITPHGKTRLFSQVTFLPTKEPDINWSAPDKLRNQIWNQLGTAVQAIRKKIEHRVEKTLPSLPADYEMLDLFDVNDVLGCGCDEAEAFAVYERLRTIISEEEKKQLETLESGRPGVLVEIENILDRRDLRISRLTKEVFMESFPIGWTPVDPFTASLVNSFAEFQRAWHQNHRAQFFAKKGESAHCLSESDFESQYGQPPWRIINEILEAAKLEFRVIEPTLNEPVTRLLFEHRSTSIPLKIEDLSSGEQVLLAVARCLFYMGSSDLHMVGPPPRLLLLDEVDSPLHPTMTDELLRVLQDIVVGRHGVAVILTTHSPSTVALAPEASTYQMSATAPRVRECTKDHLLKTLTAGLPTLSISFDNRRQVFVESEHDVWIYERVFQKLRPLLSSDVTLHFVASGTGGAGNCDHVKHLVKELAGAGNATVFGVIDWDQQNDGNERVFVLAKERRYAIENLILDPLVVAALLLREKVVSREHFRLVGNETFHDFRKLENHRLQYMVDRVVSDVRNTDSAEDEELVCCNYLCGKEVSVPVSYLHMNGHALESRLKDVFEPLKRHRAGGALVKEIIQKVIDDCPELLPMEMVDLVTQLQEAGP